MSTEINEFREFLVDFSRGIISDGAWERYINHLGELLMNYPDASSALTAQSSHARSHLGEA